MGEWPLKVDLSIQGPALDPANAQCVDPAEIPDAKIFDSFVLESANPFQNIQLTPRYLMYLFFAAGFEALRWLKVPVPDMLADAVLGRFRTATLTYKDRYLNKLLADYTHSFQEGMEYLVSRQKMPAEEAFRSLIRYLLTRRDITLEEYTKNPEVVDGYYPLTPADVLLVEAEHQLELEQMDRVAGEVAAEIFMEKEGREIRGPILLVLHQREGQMSGWEVQEWANTASLAANRLKRRLERTRGQVTRSVLNFLVQELEKQVDRFKAEGNVPEKVTIPIGNLEKISINLSEIPADQRFKNLSRFLSEGKRMLAAIQEKGELSPEDATLILSLSGEYPQINRFKALSGAMLEEEIAAIHQGIDFLFESLNIADPLSRAKKRVLLKLSEMQSGVMGYSMDGGDFQVIQWSPTMKVHDRDAARVGPYTFYESSVARLSPNGTIRYEAAMAYLDRRGRPGILTLSEFESLLALEEKLVAHEKKRPQGENIVKVYRRFLVDLKRAWKSIPWEEERARAVNLGKDRRKMVETGAERIRQLSPGYELVRLIRQSSQELIEARVYEGIRTESIVGVISRLMMRAQNFFAGSNLEEPFREHMTALADHIANGNEEGMFLERGKIKGIIYHRMGEIVGQELGHLGGNVKTGTWGEEVTGWLRVAKEDWAEVSDETLERLSLLRLNQGQTPSLKEARQFFADGRYQEALSEYGRIAIDNRTEVSTRLTALVELFRVAYFRNDVIWMNKAVGEMDYLLSVDHWRLKPEEAEMMEFALRLEEAGIIRLGHALREALRRPGPSGGEGSGGPPTGPISGTPPVLPMSRNSPPTVPAINRQAGGIDGVSVESALRTLRHVYGEDILSRWGIQQADGLDSLRRQLRDRLDQKGLLPAVERKMEHYKRLHNLPASHEMGMLVEALEAGGGEAWEKAVERGYRRIDHYHMQLRHQMEWEERRRAGRTEGGEEKEALRRRSRIFGGRLEIGRSEMNRPRGL